MGLKSKEANVGVADGDEPAPVDVSEKRSGRRPGKMTSRSDILAAAQVEFAAHGYLEATIRQIARRANVDTKLVHHFFGTKANLFSAVVKKSMDTDRLLAAFAPTPSNENEQLSGVRIVTHVLTILEDPQTGPPLLGLVRSVTTHEESRQMFKQLIYSHIIKLSAGIISGPDAEVRLSLMGSQMLGLVVSRYIVGNKYLKELSVAELAQVIGPTLDQYLFGDIELP